MLETLSLDAGGVLVRPNWVRISEIFATFGIGTSAEALSAVEWRVMRDIDSESHINATNDDDRLTVFFSRILDCAGATGSKESRRQGLAEVRRIHAKDNLWEFVPDDVIPALEQFKALGLNLIVLSNANGTVRKRFERLGMSQWFSHIVDSGEEGVEKPDPRFFGIGLARAGARPETTLHVGDLFFVDVVGARTAGIRSALIDRGGLQIDRDCPRFSDLRQLAAALSRGHLD